MATAKAAITRPVSGEYAPYYEKYIALVPEGDIVATLGQQLETTLELLEGIDESQANKRYAADKWSIKEVVGHLIDSERVFVYRAMRFARNDQTPLPGFEQDDYVRHAKFDDRQLAYLAQEFEYVATKLGISIRELQGYLYAPNKTYKDYKSQENIYAVGACVMRFFGLELGGKR